MAWGQALRAALLDGAAASPPLLCRLGAPEGLDHALWHDLWARAVEGAVGQGVDVANQTKLQQACGGSGGGRAGGRKRAAPDAAAAWTARRTDDITGRLLGGQPGAEVSRWGVRQLRRGGHGALLASAAGLSDALRAAVPPPFNRSVHHLRHKGGHQTLGHAQLGRQVKAQRAKGCTGRWGGGGREEQQHHCVQSGLEGCRSRLSHASAAPLG